MTTLLEPAPKKDPPESSLPSDDSEVERWTAIYTPGCLFAIIVVLAAACCALHGGY